MKNGELRALANEYNKVVEEGRVLYAKCEELAKRCNEIRQIIDREAPESYDPIALIFGGDMEVDLIGDDDKEIYQ